MSIATRTGDDGTTSLLYGRRVSKTNLRPCAYGTVDELSAFLGLARALAMNEWVKDEIFKVQKNLVAIMGEMAVADEDRDKYELSNLDKFESHMLEQLDVNIKKLEDMNITFERWATPGHTAGAGAIDVARTVCRRAEREVLLLQQSGAFIKKDIIQFFNRLSDVLWLMARLEETEDNN